MAIKIFNSLRNMATLMLLLVFSTHSYANGPMLQELHHTVEEARIDVSTSDNSETEGTLTALLLECSGCTPQIYNFNSTTVLINQFGAQRSIKELPSWSGNRAMFHYRKADSYVEQIQILP
ncbi:MAG: hypothetical protein COB62_07480 [Piscirickettsiaceae bacterium]|nr:hypothetical protein [Paraglaciecola sp.]PCI17532.1 MAG: hypothetical protein COB62_07480 [Piscirickettsiaceae bacterium]